eukprot:comp15778_c0_seq1/m.24427 comp15778_c0_seq1/g.24427  ORF comp15778_c0_seq1/g.24427 comp15778_c0_seq1/m.24427 type:complete len:176 (-) comp15778_c0_seq1:137-664(-)
MSGVRKDKDVLHAREHNSSTTAPGTTSVAKSTTANRAEVSRTVDTHAESAEQQYGTSRTNTVAAEKKFAHTGLAADIKSESVKKASADGKWSKEISHTTVTVAASGKCTGCSEALGTEEFMEVARKKYHNRCLLCTSCQKKLNPHRFFLDRKGEVPMCEACSKASANPGKGKGKA